MPVMVMAAAYTMEPAGNIFSILQPWSSSRSFKVVATGHRYFI